MSSGFPKTRRQVIFTTTVIFVAVLSLSSLRSLAARQLEDTRPPRAFDGVVEHLSLLETESGDLDSRFQPRTRLDTADLVDLSKIVFQSYRDGNWEIYLANGDGSAQTRLTNHAASDIDPRLNRGCTHIVFASDRSGSYEIYAMNVDGSDIVQLTSNGADDVDPTWSLDGSKIAFQSYRDGQAEIYVMNADGSDQTRLTSEGEYDGMPTWSPDGAKIGFVSYRTGGYRIWVMNADGSGATQLSNQSYSENPSWSPAGNLIAYDADVDGDGWQELCLMNADGSNQIEAYDPDTPETDAWAGSWSPDGQYVAFTQITFVYYQGYWYWLQAYLDRYHIYSFQTTRLSSEGTEWKPDWQTTDAQAPSTQVEALPLYSRHSYTPVAWSASDSGGAGVLSYDIQVAEGTGGWEDWLVNADSTHRFYSGAAGEVVKFRARARDTFYNVEAWPQTDYTAQTQLYTYLLTGSARDVRGRVVPSANVTVTPTPVEFLNTIKHNGLYRAYLSQIGTTQISATAAGYSSFAVETSASRDLFRDFWFAPLDNVVKNGSFEAGGGSLDDWQARGSLATTVVTDVLQAGSFVALLGQEIPVDLMPAQTAGEGTYPDIAVTPDQTVHMVYADEAALAVFYRYRGTGVSEDWSPPVEIGSVQLGYYTNLVHPSIAVTPDGTLHAVWNDVEGQHYSHSVPDGSWSSALWLDGDGLRPPRLASDSQGGLHVAYCTGDTDLRYLHRSPTGQWSSVQSIGRCGPDIGMVVDGEEVVHVIWEGLQGEWSATDGVFHRERHPGGSWSMPERVATFGDSPKLAVDSLGTLHAVWTNVGTVEYANKPEGGQWLLTNSLPNAGRSSDLTTDSAGTVYVVSTGYDPTSVHFFYRLADNRWSIPAELGDEVFGAVVAADANDNIHVVYSDQDAHLFYRSNERTSAAGSASLSQTVTIPDQAHDPTLSFSYRLHSTDGQNPEAFAVRISNSISSTVLFSTTVFSTVQNSAWRHQWLDLSPWTGQTIDLEFGLDVSADTGHTRLYLDEVSLGSWLTPVISSITPNAVEAWASTVITVTGENFIASPTVRIDDAIIEDVQWLDEATLRVVSPADLRPGRHDLSVINPAGQEAVLTGGLAVGKSVLLPLVAKR